MILHSKHEGLQLFFETGDKSGIRSDHAAFRVLLAHDSFIKRREHVLKGCHYDPDQPGIAEAVCQ